MPTLEAQGTYVHIPEECCVTVLMGKKAPVLYGIKIHLFRLEKKKFECTPNIQCWSHLEELQHQVTC